jgi:hypothetical protein
VFVQGASAESAYSKTFKKNVTSKCKVKYLNVEQGCRTSEIECIVAFGPWKLYCLLFNPGGQ